MTWADFKTRWEYRSVAFIFKFIGVILFLCYVVAGFGAAQTLLTAHAIKQQPLDALPQIITTSVGNNDSQKVTQWVRFRPLTETDQIIKIISPLSGDLSPTIFFEFARRMTLINNPEETLNWTQIARYRLRYDMLRCGASDDARHILEGFLNGSSSTYTQDFLVKHPEHIKKSIQHTLDFDKKYPAKNNPRFICDITRKLSKTTTVPPEKAQWENIRETLRSVTEVALEEMNKDTSEPTAQPAK